MRDPDRIEPMLTLVEQIWHQEPDLRLAQLITIAAVRGGWKNSDVFSAEDDIVRTGLTEWLSELGFRDVLGSDVPSDGTYLELRDRSDHVVASVFRSDATGELEVQFGPAEAPSRVLEAFVERAKKRLAERTGE